MSFLQYAHYISELNDFLVGLMSEYGSPVILLTSFFTGEIGVISGFVLAANGFLGWRTVFLYSFLGTLCADVFWYAFGGYAVKFFRKSLYYKIKNQPQAENGRERNMGILFSFLILKFLYGTRLITLIKHSIKRTPIMTFLFFDAIGTTLYVSVLFAVGWLTGKGISFILPLYHNAIAVLVIGDLVIIGIYAVSRFLPKNKIR